MTKGSNTTARPVSLTALARGIRAVIDNAESVLHDAHVLFRRKCYGRAFSLAISAIEEAGKVHVLFKMANLDTRNQRQWNQAWREFRDHKYKSTVGLVQSVIALNAARGDDAVVFAMLQRGQAGGVEQLRQQGLYVDYDFAASRWIRPARVSRKRAAGVLAIAEAAVRREVRLRNIGLYRPSALALKRQMYAGIQGLLADGPITSAASGELIERAKIIHRAFFRALRKLGIRIPEGEISF